MTALDTQLGLAARAWVAGLRRRPLGLFVGVMAAALVLFVTFAQPPKAQAFSSYLTAFELQYPTAAGSKLDSCILCHTTTSGGPLNSYGSAYGANGHSFAAIETMDSDRDGFSNIAEINALTFPGDPADHPVQSPTSSPTPTATSTTPPATPTATSPNPTATAAGPTPTPTGTIVAPPPGAPGLDIRMFSVAQRVTLGRGQNGSVWIWLVVKKNGATGGRGTANVVGVQNGVKVYDVSIAVSATDRSRGRYFFPRYAPTVAGKIMWTATLNDGDPVIDTASAVTEVTTGRPSDDNPAQRPTARPDGSDNERPAAQQPVVSDNAPAAQRPTAQPVVSDNTSSSAGACAGTHVVAAGENLFRIGYNCGFSLQQMAFANGIDYPYRIHPGQTLRYP